MLEKVALQLVNRFIGAYVENLDSNNLKLGLFGGNAVIENLRVRENALDDFDIPFRVKVGHLGRLTLNVPWKTMLTSSKWTGIATLEDVYLVLVPRAAMKFDPEKDKKERFDSKTKQLEQIEATLAAKLELNDAKTDKKGEKADESWIDKLIVDCVRNFQVVIRNIHIRYEDSVSNPSAPLACGVSFANLTYNMKAPGSAEVLRSLQSNDDALEEQAQLATPLPPDNRICTQLQLDSFAVYLDPLSPMWSSMSRPAAIGKMRDAVVNGGNYVLRPLRVDCALWIDMRPSVSNYVRPRIEIACRLPKIDFALAHKQYVAVMTTFCEFQRVLIQSRYNGYDRPTEHVIGNSRKWWLYAYRVIVVEKVKREIRKWKWDSVKTHVRNCRAYKTLYLKTLSSGAANVLSPDEQAALMELTVELDAFNIVRMRQQAAIDLAKAEGEKQKQKQQKSWLNYFWGLKPTETVDQPAQKPVIDVLSDEEKAQLRQLVDKGVPLESTAAAPLTFVNFAMRTRLDEVTLSLSDGNVTVAALHMRKLSSSLALRSIASAMKVTARMQSLTLTGTDRNVSIIRSAYAEDTALSNSQPFFSASFETNPLQSEQLSALVRATLRPAQFVADTKTVNSVLRFITLPNNIVMRKALSTNSSSMRQNVDVNALLRKRYRSDVLIEIEPSVFILPANGVYETNSAAIALSCGHLTLRSVPLSEQQLMIRNALINGDKKVQMSEAENCVFDAYSISLTDVQCIVARAGEQYASMFGRYDVSSHLFSPISLEVALKQSVLVDDSRFAQNRIEAELNLLRVAVCDGALREALRILLSIKQQLNLAPNQGDQTDGSGSDSGGAMHRAPSVDSNLGLEDDQFYDAIEQLGREADADSVSVSSGFEEEEEERLNKKRRRLADVEAKRRREAESITQLAVSLTLRKLEIALFEQTQLDTPLVQFQLIALQTEFAKRPFDESAAVKIGACYVQYRHFDLLKSTADVETDATLSVNYRRVNEDAPSFVDVHERTAMRVDVLYDKLDVVLHRERVDEAASYLLGFYVRVASDMLAQTQSEAASVVASTSEPAAAADQKGLSDYVPSADARNTVALRLTATVRQLAVEFATDQLGAFASLQLGLFTTQLNMQFATVRARVALGHITLRDLSSTRYHDLLALDENAETKELIVVNLTLNDTALMDKVRQNGVSLYPSDAVISDCDVQLAIGRVRFVYLQPFLNRIVKSLDSLQVPLQRMQNEMRAASRKIAEQAQTLQLAERVITLDAQFNAPLIEVPRSANSESRFVLDFGQLSVNRSYSKSADGQLSNSVRVTLANLQVVANSHSILEPVSFALEVAFSRVAEGEGSVQAVKVKAHLHEVRLAIHDDDAVLLTGVYADNVSTYTEITSAPAASDAGQSEPAKGEVTPHDGDTQDAMKTFENTVTRVSSMQIGIEVAFDELTIALHTRSVSIAQSGQLAKFQLSALALNATVLSNAQVLARLSIARWSLDDLRVAAAQPSYAGITRLVDNTGSSSVVSGSEVRNLITFQLSISPDKQIDTKVDIDGISLCASVDFINALVAYANAFVQQLGALSGAKSSDDKSAPVEATAQRASTLSSTQKAKSSSALVLRARFELNASQLILVEHIEAKTSDAFVVSFECHGQMRLDDQLALSSTFQLNDMLCCPYDPAARANRTTRVLNPVGIRLNVQRDDEPPSLRVSVDTDDFVLHVTPQLIRFAGSTLTAALGNAKHDTSSEKQEERHAEDVLVPEGFWKCRALPKHDCSASNASESDDFWYLRDASTVTEVAKEAADWGVVNKAIEHLSIIIPRIVVNLEDVIDAGSTMPVLSVETSLNGGVDSWSSALRLHMTCTLVVSYYNDQIGLWEPLVEPTELVHSTFAPYTFDLKVYRNQPQPPVSLLPRSASRDTIADSADDEDAEMVVNFTSSQILNLTLTDASIKLLLRTAEQFSKVFKLEANDQLDAVDNSNLHLHNDTGETLVFVLDKNRFRFIEPSSPTTSPAGVILRPGAVLALRELGLADSRLRAPPDFLRGESSDPHLRKLTGGISADALVTYTAIASRRSAVSFSVAVFDAARNENSSSFAAISLSGCSENRVVELFDVGGSLLPAATATKTVSTSYIPWRKLQFQKPPKPDEPQPMLLGLYVNVSLQRTELRLHSAVQLRNELPVPISVSVQTSKKAAQVWASLAPQAEVYLPMAYATSDTSLLLAPADYKPSNPIKLFERQDAVATCTRIDDANKSFVVKVCARVTKPDLSGTSSLTALYTYTLRPLIRFYNLLPFGVTVKQDMRATTVPLFADHQNIESGRSVDLCDVPFFKMPLEFSFVYRGVAWRTSWLPVAEPPPMDSIKFQKASDSPDKSVFTLTLQTERQSGVLCVTLCATYWLVNKTGLDLVYEFHKAGKESIKKVEQPANMVEPVVMSAKQKWLHKETMSFTIKNFDCGMSESFSLEAVGNSGKVECKDKKGRVYHFSVKIELSTTRLTKLVTIMPYFVMVNRLDRAVRVLESDGGKGTLVKARDVSAFWPTQSGPSYQLSVEVQIEQSKNAVSQFLYSPAFPLRDSGQSVFRLSDAGALSVDVRATDESIAILLGGYKPGLCPLQVVNDTNRPFFVRQAKAERFLRIEPASAVMFALANVDLARAVEWSDDANAKPNAVKTCELADSVSTCPDGSYVQMCFMDGAQRVLIFTSSEHVLRNIIERTRACRPQIDFILRLNAIGLSLVNTVLRSEILYARIFSRGVLWRKRKFNPTATNKKNEKDGRLRPVEADLAPRLETAYQKFIDAGRKPDLAIFKDGDYEVDFSAVPPLMRKPHQHTLKRSDEPGIWMQLRRSALHTELQLKVQLVQIDSTLPDAQFATLFAIVPPYSTSGSEYQDFLTRPFFELSLVLDKHTSSDVLQFRFLKLLVQEAFIHVDRYAIVALLAFAAQLTRKQSDTFTDFQFDHRKTLKSLKDLLFEEFSAGGSEQMHYFGVLHLSPIKLNVSIALGGSGERASTQTSNKAGTVAQVDDSQDDQSFAIDRFLQLTGVGVVDASDVLLKLAYFERTDRCYTQGQLLREIQTHYVRIAMRQVLKFVLGLDVIGNPYGVLRDFQRGVEDLFYEPYTGAMEGPSEFVAGMQQGVKSLVKNTVGGMAGGVSKITGALGKALASATFDDDFKKERAKKLRDHQSQGVQKNITSGASSIFHSVGHAAAGVFTKPVEGAKQGGTMGFFKGIGKGLVGLVAVPTATIADAASSALQSVQRAADARFQVERVRQPRYFGPRSALRPYLTREAAAAAFLALKQLSDETPLSHDEYIFHATLSSKSNFESMMIVTDLRALLITRDNLNDNRHWRTNLTIWYDELAALPKWGPSGAVFASRDEKLAGSKQGAAKTGVHNFVLQFEEVHLGQFLVAVIGQILRRKYDFK